MNKLFPQPYMPIGSRGPAVVVLQLLLIALGFNNKIVADGDFGEQTADGVKAFQCSVGLEQDGCFGPATRKAFDEKFNVDVNTIGDLSGVTTVPETKPIGEPVEPQLVV